MTNLVTLELFNINVSGSIPPELGQLTSLTRLDLHWNDNLSGSIPPELGQLTSLTYLSIEAGVLGSGKLSGSIPPELGQLTSLTLLDLNGHQLSGSIPPELGQLTSLANADLILRYNRLTGCIPVAVSRFHNINPQQGSVSLPVCPGTPTGLDATADEGQVTLSWTAPSGTVTKYQYRQSTDSGVTWSPDWTDTGTTPPTATTVTLTGLANGVAYTFQVRAVNTGGNGAASAAATATPASRVQMSESMLTVPEGGMATYTVVLGYAPTAAVTVTPAATGDGDLTLAPAALTFTTANWNTAQTVTVSAADDGDAADGTATIAHTAVSTDSGYGGIVIASVTATEDDDDTPGVQVSKTSVTVNEVGSATWTVALATLPTAAVTVTVAKRDGGDDDLTVSPAALTFTTSDWSTAQTVTVSAADDADDTHGKAVFTHNANGGGYDGLTATVTATEADDDDVTPPTVTTLSSERQSVGSTEAFEVTVTFSEPVTGFAADDIDVTNGSAANVAGSGADYTADITPDGEGDIAIRIVAGAAVDGAGNPSEAAETLTVAWDATPPTVTLSSEKQSVGSTEAFEVAVTFSEPVTGFAADDIAVTNGEVTDDSVKPVPDSEVAYTADIAPDGEGDITIRIVAGAAVDGADSKSEASETVIVVWDATPPTVTIAAPESVSDTEAFEVTVTFSEPVTGFAADDIAVTNGEVTDGSVKPVPDSEVAYTADITPDGEGNITIEIAAGAAKDLAGNKSEASETVTVVWDTTGPVDRVNAVVVPVVAQAMVGSAVGAVSDRVAAAVSGAVSGAVSEPGFSLGGHSSLAAFMASNGEALARGSLDPLRVLAGSSFSLGGGGSGGGGGVGLWGSGDYRSLSGSSGGVSWDGRVTSGHLGADARLGAEWLGGLAVSLSEGRLDYTDSHGDETRKGRHESRLTSASPYVGWKGRGGVSAWGLMSFGRGSVEVAEDGRDETARGDLEQRSLAAGAAWRVYGASGGGAAGTRVTVKAQGRASQVEVKGRTSMSDMDADMQQVRLGAEASHGFALASGSMLTPSAELGVRHDDGDGETGTGVELGAGLVWRDAGAGLTVEGRARLLAAHSGDNEEWGVRGLVRLDAGPSGRGLSLRFGPSWGETASNVDRLWNDNAAVDALTPESAPARPGLRVDTELGYGLARHGGRALLTPYGRLSLNDDGGRRTGLGSRFTLGPALEFDLEAAQHETASSHDPDRSLTLTGRLRF